MTSGPNDTRKLQRRREQLRGRKHSFVELIMQTKKSLYKDKMRRELERESSDD